MELRSKTNGIPHKLSNNTRFQRIKLVMTTRKMSGLLRKPVCTASVSRRWLFVKSHTASFTLAYRSKGY